MHAHFDSRNVGEVERLYLLEGSWIIDDNAV